MNNKTEAKKVTLRPKQLKKVLRVAKKDYDGNFSLALRVMVDKFEDEPRNCNNCKSFPGFCSVGGAIEIHELRDLDDFYCGDWEKKDEL